MLGFEITEVSDSFVVMAVRQDSTAERGIRRNVDMPFISEDMVIILLV